MANNLAAAVFGRPVNLPKVKVAVQLPEEKLKTYVGEYQLMPDFTVVIRLENGTLRAKPTGQSEAELSAEN